MKLLELKKIERIKQEQEEEQDKIRKEKEPFFYNFEQLSNILFCLSSFIWPRRGHYEFDAIFRICNGQFCLVVSDPPLKLAAL